MSLSVLELIVTHNCVYDSCNIPGCHLLNEVSDSNAVCLDLIWSKSSKIVSIEGPGLDFYHYSSCKSQLCKELHFKVNTKWNLWHALGLHIQTSHQLDTQFWIVCLGRGGPVVWFDAFRPEGRWWTTADFFAWRIIFRCFSTIYTWNCFCWLWIAYQGRRSMTKLEPLLDRHPHWLVASFILSRRFSPFCFEVRANDHAQYSQRTKVSLPQWRSGRMAAKLPHAKTLFLAKVIAYENVPVW